MRCKARAPKLCGIKACWMLLLVMSGTPAFAAPTIDWDRVANIKEAAVRLGNVQKRQGATKAFDLIVACYKTHGASSKYTKYFESCIAQDFIHTQTLMTIYSRMPPDALKKLRAPSPQLLAKAMSQRVSGAFAKYDIPPADANAYKKLVDQYGFRPFAEIVFPKAAKAGKGGTNQDDQTDNEPKPDAEKRQDRP